MQIFEFGLAFNIQNHIKSNKYDTLKMMYKKAAQIRNIFRKEKEKTN